MSSTPLRILLLEDSPGDAELIHSSLAGGGVDCVVRRVQSRGEFEAELAEGCPDVILSAYALPAFAGDTVLKVVRGVCPEVPLLFVAGAIGEELAVETLRNGATDYVHKTRLELLASAVRRAVRESEERAEQRQVVQALQQSEERFRRMVETVQDHAIFLLDPSGHVLTWNEGAENLLGYTAAEVTGAPFGRFFAPVPDGENDEGTARCALALAAQEGRGQFETWLLRKDGSRFWASGAVAAVPAPADAGRCFTVILRDRSDSWRLEETLRQQTDQLAAAVRSKDEFLAMLAHELRNPLMPITNALFLLRACDFADPILRDARAIIERQVQHLTQLVDDLRDTFALGQRKVLLRQERVDLVRLVRLAVEEQRQALREAGLVLAAALPPAPVWVLGDAARLAQVVRKLIRNAVPFTPSGGRVSVRVSADAADRVTVAVRDGGRGCPTERLPRVFDAFEQADAVDARVHGGLGLSLTLVKGLVELHGGQLRISSGGAGQGTEWSFTLPALKEQPRAAPARPGKGLRILIVEDNLDAARTLRILLTRSGHEVTLAHTGTEGVAAARGTCPDVVLCDLGLPEMDGFEVARTLRQQLETSSCPLIAVSGYGQEEDRRRCREAGFDLHMTKPVDPVELERVLSTLKK